MPNRSDSERIAVIEEVVLDLKKRLFGNGQPGEIDKLETRVDALEQWKWMIWGGAALLGAMASVAVAALKG